jgi:hypothetical protein
MQIWTCTMLIHAINSFISISSSSEMIFYGSTMVVYVKQYHFLALQKWLFLPFLQFMLNIGPQRASKHKPCGLNSFAKNSILISQGYFMLNTTRFPWYVLWNTKFLHCNLWIGPLNPRINCYLYKSESKFLYNNAQQIF